MLNALSAMAGQIEMLQAMLRGANGAVIDLKEKSKEKAKKEIKEDKPKREMSDGLKAWHTFNKRIDTVLKEAENTFKRVAESKKFASHLKKLKATEEWADAEILEEREKWVETPVETKVTEVNESAESSETSSSDEGKKAGRPKMTEEEKAAAKVKRETKKAAMTEEEIAEAKAKKEAAKAKKAAMSDEETKLKTPVKKSKIGSAPGAPKKEAKVAWADSDATDVSDVIKELDEHLASE